MAELNISLNIDNIGPHKKINFTEKTTSLKMGIYANNGSGKTFISKLFRLIEESNIEKSNKLLSFGKNQGKMKFEISSVKKDKTPIIKTLEFDINRDNLVAISSPLPFIFHVFNSDYVKESIEAFGYRPDGNIEGYILGKIQIDLSKEKDELKNKNKTLEVKKEKLKQRINEQKTVLDDRILSINKSTTEYRNFTFENILGKKDLEYIEEKSFEELKKDNTTLNTLPDDLNDVQLNDFDIKIDFLNDLEQVLNQSYSKSHFAEEFKTKIKSKQSFIDNGLKIITDNKCPFCEQDLNKQSLELIDTYTKYLSDEEAKIISKMAFFIKKINELKSEIDNAYKRSLKSKTEFDNLKEYLPTYKEQNIELLWDSKNIEEDFKTMILTLEDKKEDISKILNVKVNIKNIELCKKTNNDIFIKNNKKISELNKAKNNTSNEKLNIKKRLCKAKYLATLQSEIKNIDEILNLEKEIKKLEQEINIKENKIKTSKKEKVAETFEGFLNTFFAGKYTFNKESFCLKFDTNNLIDNASDVLSDGEKNIVAFCLYLAETHKKIEKEDDYKKLFFIIDDPISSLDFHYVYSVAQIIRRLNDKNRFPIGDRIRFFILTHNIEFMSILIRNKIINGRFILENSEIKVLQKELIMPYEEHLRDVYKVSNGTKQPLHTTPNSIRHILETINKFEKPNLDFIDYCEEIKLLEDDNEFLYALIHDNSHGNYREQRAFTPDMIIKGCKKVIEVISGKFGGQLEVIRKNIG